MATHALNMTHQSVWDQFARAATTLNRRFAAWHAVRVARARVAEELNAYTDRELSDIGISRYDIPAVVNGTYQR